MTAEDNKELHQLLSMESLRYLLMNCFQEDMPTFKANHFKSSDMIYYQKLMQPAEIAVAWDQTC